MRVGFVGYALGIAAGFVLLSAMTKPEVSYKADIEHVECYDNEKAALKYMLRHLPRSVLK